MHGRHYLSKGYLVFFPKYWLDISQLLLFYQHTHACVCVRERNLMHAYPLTLFQTDKNPRYWLIFATEYLNALHISLTLIHCTQHLVWNLSFSVSFILLLNDNTPLLLPLHNFLSTVWSNLCGFCFFALQLMFSLIRNISS